MSIENQKEASFICNLVELLELLDVDERDDLDERDDDM